MDRKTATTIDKLQELGMHKEAERLGAAVQLKTASTMPLFRHYQKVSLTYHNSAEALSGVVLRYYPDKGMVRIGSPMGKRNYLWTGKIFEDVDASGKFATLVAVYPEYIPEDKDKE